MDWFLSLFNTNAPSYSAVAESLLVLGLTAAIGIAIGNIRIRGVGIGVTGVLFAGLALAHFGLTIDPGILEFVREFGLILFVYTIGIQVGPGLTSSIRREGIRFNSLALLLVMLGFLITVAIHFWGNVETPAAAGLFSGATTNTPSLAAAQQALADKTDKAAIRSLTSLAYAVSYPCGVIGLILSMILLRTILKIDISKEKKEFIQAEEERKPHLDFINLEVLNQNLEGLKLKEVPFHEKNGVVISRIMHNGTMSLADSDTTVHLNDILLAVGPLEELEKLRIVVGKESSINLMELKSSFVWNWIMVTKKAAIGKSIHELNLRHRFEVNVARISRADIQLPVSRDVRLQFGDRISVVGTPEGLYRVAEELGNAPKELDHPMLIPMFIGIVVGVIAGSIPFSLPFLPVPVKLGLAGGPLLVAIILSRIGRIGPLVWYMPLSANFTLREVGISLFLSCVGLYNGDKFLETLLHGDGIRWMLLAVMITIIPPIVTGVVSRWLYQLNYLSICGLLAGSMTDPPALAYVTNSTDSEAPSIAYATVYPLAMFLRVVMAQILIIYFF